MTKSFQVVVSQVDGPLFAGDALSVTVPGTEGEMTVLAGHEALVTTLKEGTVTVRTSDDSTHEFPIHSGVLEITPTEAVVLL